MSADLEDDVQALVAALAAAPSPAKAPAEGEIGRTLQALDHSISHLERSNRELEEHMREHGHDKALREAIGENILVIARRKAIAADLRKQAGMAPAPAAATVVSGGEPMAVDVSAGGEPAAADASGIYL